MSDNPTLTEHPSTEHVVLEFLYLIGLIENGERVRVAEGPSKRKYTLVGIQKSPWAIEVKNDETGRTHTAPLGWLQSMLDRPEHSVVSYKYDD